jgi:diguanylate cyclase (GGDEF)-like protein
MITKNLLNILDDKPVWVIILVAFGICIFAGIIEVLIGPEVSSAIFYVFPISIAAWYGNRYTGLLTAITAALIWLATDKISGRHYSHPAIIYWNATVRLGLFVIIAFLITGFRTKLKEEEALADYDPLTGALNSRGFYQRAEKEVARCRRFQRSLSIAYIDLDNFKAINDKLGHTAGDELLQTVGSVILQNIRRIDLLARLGGDEFAVVFIETGEIDSISAVRKIKNRLLQAMIDAGWPVTFSIGLVTYEVMPENLKEMVKHADSLMYAVKRSGKNGFQHSVLK